MKTRNRILQGYSDTELIKHLASALEHVKGFSSIPRKWKNQDEHFDDLIYEAFIRTGSITYEGPD